MRATINPAIIATLSLTLACGDCEIVWTLRDGKVTPDGIDLTILTEMDSMTRHRRFLGEGHLDLAGKRVGVKSFLVTAIHWMRGILEHEYGVPHKSIHWVAEFDEDIDFVPPPGLEITRLPHDKSVEAMLAEGEIDALIHPDIIKPIGNGDPRVGRLWPDYKAEEIRFFRKTQIFPIMRARRYRRRRYGGVPKAAARKSIAATIRAGARARRGLASQRSSGCGANPGGDQRVPG